MKRIGCFHSDVDPGVTTHLAEWPILTQRVKAWHEEDSSLIASPIDSDHAGKDGHGVGAGEAALLIRGSFHLEGLGSWIMELDDGFGQNV